MLYERKAISERRLSRLLIQAVAAMMPNGNDPTGSPELNDAVFCVRALKIEQNVNVCVCVCVCAKC